MFSRATPQAQITPYPYNNLTFYKINSNPQWIRGDKLWSRYRGISIADFLFAMIFRNVRRNNIVLVTFLHLRRFHCRINRFLVIQSDPRRGKVVYAYRPYLPALPDIFFSYDFEKNKLYGKSKAKTST